MQPEMNYVGSLLVSSPFLRGELFAGSVIFIYEDSEEYGTHGAIINQSSDVSVEMVLDDLGFPTLGEYEDLPVFHGGVAYQSAVMLIHSSDWRSKNTRIITPELAISSDLSMFSKLTEGDAPDDWRLCAGQCSWYSGQLDDEIEDGLWTVVPATTKTVFGNAGQAQWRRSLREASHWAVNQWL